MRRYNILQPAPYKSFTSMEEIKKQLQERVSSLRSEFTQLSEGIEWSMNEELYPQVSKVYREIESLEEIIRNL